jgi:hypothetical protein
MRRTNYSLEELRRSRKRNPHAVEVKTTFSVALMFDPCMFSTIDNRNG